MKIDYTPQRFSGFDKGVAAKVGPMAHTLMDAVEGTIELLGLDRENVADRRRALAVTLKLRPDFAAGRDEELVVSGFARSEAAPTQAAEAIDVDDPEEALAVRLAELEAAGKVKLTFAEDAAGERRVQFTEPALAALRADPLGKQLLAEGYQPGERAAAARFGRRVLLALREVAQRDGLALNTRGGFNRAVYCLFRDRGGEDFLSVGKAQTLEAAKFAVLAREKKLEHVLFAEAPAVGFGLWAPPEEGAALRTALRERPDLGEPLDRMFAEQRQQHAEARRTALAENAEDADARFAEELEREAAQRGVVRPGPTERRPERLAQWRELVEEVARRHAKSLRAARGR